MYKKEKKMSNATFKSNCMKYKEICSCKEWSLKGICIFECTFNSGILQWIAFRNWAKSCRLIEDTTSDLD